MVDTVQPHCLFASESRSRRHAKMMNLRKVEKRELLTPLRRLDAKGKPSLPVKGEVFLLRPDKRKLLLAEMPS